MDGKPKANLPNSFGTRGRLHVILISAFVTTRNICVSHFMSGKLLSSYELGYCSGSVPRSANGRDVILQLPVHAILHKKGGVDARKGPS